MLARMNSKISAQTLRFVRRGQAVALGNVAPDRTLLEVLREDLQLTATKEGCGEGDCGACTVVLAQAVNGKLQYQAINSCIRLAHSVDGMAVFTAEDLSAPTLKAGASPDLHPCQEAMVQCHGSQCGFCTPGFVMSLLLRDEPVRHVPEQQERSGDFPRTSPGRSLGQPLPLHRLPPHPRRC